MATILAIGAMDTKGEETVFLKKYIEQNGCKSLILDIGMGKESPQGVEISNGVVAEAGGMSISEVMASRDRKKITETIIRGATVTAKEIIATGKADAVIGVGGTTGTVMTTQIMRELPFAIPKLMISSAAPIPGLCTRFFGSADITMMYTVAEVGGLNYFIRPLLASGAAAICGMAKAEPRKIFEKEMNESKGLVAMSQLGGCEKCATYIKKYLSEKGWDVLGFMANGLGDRAMEDQISQGDINGVIDLTPGAVAEQLFGGTRKAGPHRLEAAGARGIPQIIAPFSLNMFMPSKKSYKPEYESRRKLDLDQHRTIVKLSPAELIQTARTVAEKLNKSKGPVKFMIPLRGWSNIEKEGLPFYDPEADAFFVGHLKEHLRDDIEIEEIDANLEDDAFALAVATSFEKLCAI
jgi:uncharacterized protein (UPF0261 family)